MKKPLLQLTGLLSIVALLVALGTPPPVAQAAFTVGTASTGSTTTLSHTVAAGTDILVVGAMVETAADVNLSATWNGGAMTKFVEEDACGGTVGATLFYLDSPTAGTHDVVISGGTINSIRVFAADLDNKNITDSVGTTQSNFLTHVPSSSLTTDGTGDGVCFDVRAVNNTGGYTVDSGQTQIVNASSFTAGYTALASYRKYTAGNDCTMSWTGASAVDIEAVGEWIAEADANGGTTMLMGMTF